MATKKTHPADVADLALIPACKKFTATILKNNKPQTVAFDTLAAARIEATRLNATANNGRKALVYAITAEDRAVLVPASYGSSDTSEKAKPAGKAEAKPAKAEKPAEPAKPRRPKACQSCEAEGREKARCQEGEARGQVEGRNRHRDAHRQESGDPQGYRRGCRLALDQRQGDLRSQRHEAKAGRRRHALRIGPEVSGRSIGTSADESSPGADESCAGAYRFAMPG